MTQPLLKIDNLRTYFYARSKQAFVRSVDGVSLEVGRRETVGVVGESGSGKSITAMSVMGLLSGGPGVIGGSIRYARDDVQRNLLEGLGDYVQVEEQDGRVTSVCKEERGWQRQSEKLQQGIRGREIAMIFQNPRTSLNPYMAVGEQIAEAVRLHGGIRNGKEARERAIHWLERVRIDSPHLRYNSFPAGLSGGMCQRAMIAMALSAEPSLLIADEPTTGLDATIQSKIVDLLEELKGATGISTLLISHDISVITRLSDRVAVLYGGTVVEYGPARKVLDAHEERKHPYTAALLASVPSEQKIRTRARLQAIEGEVLDTISVPAGCRFQARCNRITPEIRHLCANQHPELIDVTPGHQLRCWRFVKQGE
ncbi:MAG TPA: ABC transporter ATP-binding protein [Gallionellaceae bacterium]|nr:ABC transporter ATP-binding protein [Gallionellaceae bacterium]